MNTNEDEWFCLAEIAVVAELADRRRRRRPLPGFTTGSS